MTGDEKQVLQQLIDDVYGQFIEAISEGRGMPLDGDSFPKRVTESSNARTRSRFCNAHQSKER